MPDPSSLKHITCAVCGADSFSIKYSVKQLHVVQCRICTFVYVNPRIEDEEIYALYKKNYFNNSEIGYSDYILNKNALIKTFKERFNFIKPYFKSNENSLDIGCAEGYFLDVLAEKGWKGIEGIELDNELANRLNSKYKIFTQPIEKVELNKKYMLITLFDVIEHIPLLNEALENIKNNLHEDGVFAIATPNYNSWQRKLLGKRWPHLKPEEHIYYFTSETLSKILARHQLKVEKIIPRGTYYDVQYIQKRLKQYGFPALHFIATFLIKVLKLKNKFVYVNSGSMLAIVKHA